MQNYSNNTYKPHYTVNVRPAPFTAPPAYRSENDPLLGWEPERREITLSQCLAFFAFAFMGYHAFMHLVYCPTALPGATPLFWGHVEPRTCTTYATREYTAQLLNIPPSSSADYRLRACVSTPLEIHGVSHLPTSCEDRGPGVVIGRWEIKGGEPSCVTYWDEYNDKGCTSPGSGKRHYTHKLMNVPEGSDWREFCATTPISFNNMYFPGAQECFPSIWGIYGRWEVEDRYC